MSEKQPRPLKLTASEVLNRSSGHDLPLPGILRTTTRSGVSEIDPLLEGIRVEKVYNLAAPTRGGVATVETLDTARHELLAVEAEDGTTLFIRSDALAEAVARVRPEAVVDGVVDFSQFRDPNATNRGFADVLWKLASVIQLPTGDDLLAEAKKKAEEWAREQLGDLIQEKAYELGSFLGAKALIWKIESRLAGRPGLYRWHDRVLTPGDQCLRDDPRLKPVAEGRPALVLIHGTGSYTLGSFSDLREDEATWKQLEQRFPGGIYGFEHRTFSESPAENALALLEALPKGAHVSLLTHSRGGLVGDLLCLGTVDDKVIDAYRIDTRDSDDPDGLEREAREERQRLRDIRDKLAGDTPDGPHIKVERYVRVACPARGTRFLSENLDAALSDFLSLVQWGGGALVGAAASALGGPVAGETFGKGASSALGVLKRLVLEIANRRIDPRMLPGIAAMRTDSPLAAFLAHPQTLRRSDIQMAVIAGDTEFDGLGLSNLRRRIANLFCDWRLFDKADNDLVVDTDSMYAGLAFREGASYLYDQDESVSHFRYFRNLPTQSALRSWLVEDDLRALNQFQPLAPGHKVPWRDRPAPAGLRGGPAGPCPVVILIPGIMGTHIEVNRKRPHEPGSGDRIWFDPGSLLVGKLDRIRDPGSDAAVAEDLFEMFYGDLADHLAETHAVIRCPYDWRQPLDRCAAELKARIEQAAREQPGQPIRLLAHSMGGLVSRALIKLFPEAWQTVLSSGGRLVMLGTPNNGSHLMVHSLLGKSDSMRKLEKIDVTHGLQEILDIVAGFPGGLALLPRPGFADTGSDPRIAASEYYRIDTWKKLKEQNTDRWYDDRICGVPGEECLSGAEDFWNKTLPGNEIPNPERVVYVYGQGDKTPCGVQRTTDGRLRLLFTPYGDGSVTWKSGRLDDLDDRSWYMPVEHGDLAGEEEYFPAIVELLDKGVTDKLGRLPRERAETVPNFVLEAEPPVIPSNEELARAVMGSGLRRRKPSRVRQALRVSVRAGDLRFLDHPVLCGHYIGDAISGAEAALDDMLNGALSERERLGIYASDIGTSAIVLCPPSGEERRRGSMPGAVIVGLGSFTGQLSARQVTETVRAALLRFLLELRDTIGVPVGAPVQINSVLIGWGSTTSISVAESVAAVTRGVLEANRQFRDALGKASVKAIAVTDLQFIELYRDVAISAARAVLDLPEQLGSELKRMGTRIEPQATLTEGDGVLERLSSGGDLGHWSRLIVTDADAAEIYCPPECYEVQLKSPMPRETLRRLCGQARCSEDVGAAPPAGVSVAVEKPEGLAPANPAGTPLGKPADAPPAEARYYPERLKYVFLSRGARAETVWQQRQPGLVEAIISTQRRVATYDAKLGYTLFQLMVPLDYKAVAREQSRLLLVLDGYTANLPWELLQADGEALVLRTPMVRQLATSRYRLTVRTANCNAGCIIANPSTYGYDKRFPGGKEKLDDLPGAEREGTAIGERLRDAGWSDIVLTPPGKEALDIFNVLYQRPYRVLVIGAHGIFEAKGHDGRAYTGVVLSDGLLITAVEISQMEVVPEVVFLSCCHLGSVSNPYSQPNRLAYGLSRELVEMGVRCVVAAGWAVNDDAACTFASTFFARLTDGETFGEAVFAARKAAFQQHPGSNTWGAYQAYGDPGYRLQPRRREQDGDRGRPYVALDELLAALHGQRVNNKRLRSAAKVPSFARQSQWVQRQLGKCPPGWAERPDVLQAIGVLYGEFGADGCEAARDAYERAVQLEDKAGRVAVKAIEQLANLESRRGGKLVEKGDLEGGLKLIESGIRRMTFLADAVRGAGAPQRNAERAGILGSAYKLKAAALAMMNEPWPMVSAALTEAVRAYQSAVQGDPAMTPYNTLNVLPLAWLCGALDQTTEEAVTLARRCGEQARNSFATSKDFWDAVMSVDADMTAWLLGGELEEPSADRRPRNRKPRPAELLKQRYEETVRALPQTAREWDSVVKQWRLLARFLRLRAQTDDVDRADVLDELADHYVPRAPAGSTQAVHESAPSPSPPPEPGSKQRASKSRSKKKS